MGGAIFTLADFALAIASNIGEEPSVAVSNTINFMSATKGSVLKATCDVDKSGRRLGFYTVNVEKMTQVVLWRRCARPAHVSEHGPARYAIIVRPKLYSRAWCAIRETS